MSPRAYLLLVSATLLACDDTSGPSFEDPVSVSLEPVVQGLSSPIFLTAPPGDTDRLFVVEQGGRIRIVRDGSLEEPPFLDVGDLVSNTLGPTQIVRYSVSADPDVADARSALPTLTVEQPYSNHNGGMIAFGPNDGMLFVGMGDGGSGGDPRGHGQNRMTLLGDMLRLDVDGGMPYPIPADNPYAGSLSVANEIWSSGLRNPWRFSFDRATGDLYIGDVGQNEWEEISFQHAASDGGENYGWALMEGRHCYPASAGCTGAGLALPVHEYPHSGGCSLAGGYVYRGADSPRSRAVTSSPTSAPAGCGASRR